jgi:hypothetical protein
LFFRHIQDNSEKEKEGGKERQLDWQRRQCLCRWQNGKRIRKRGRM